MESRSRKHMVAFGVIAGVCGSMLALYCFDPSTTAIYPPCPFHAVTGFHCPGCGSLRALHSLLHGHIAAAMSQNPLMVICLPILGLMFTSPKWIYRPWVPWTAMVVLLAYGIIRNIPVAPLTSLAPH